MWSIEISKGYVSKRYGCRLTCDLPCSQANILIDHSGHAHLADFSLLTITPDQSTVISTCIQGGTVQWMSPELIDPDRFGLKKILLTKESDCYALGMVIYEVLSGRAPFAPLKSPLATQKVLEGERPKRPEGEERTSFTDGIWEMLEHCWKHQPNERISAEVVLQCLEGTPLLPPLNQLAPSELEAGFQPTCTVDRTMITGGLFEETIGARVGERLDATPANDSSTFSTSCQRPQAHLPCDITGPTIRCSGGGLTVPPQSFHHTTIMDPSTDLVGDEGDGSGWCNCVIM